ncbi:MAG: zinc-finger domain-containing protein [Geminicoccaceae bacterium]
MTETADVTKVDSKSVACDGGAAQLGHPRVYLAIDESNQVICPYCNQLFVFDPKKTAAE